ncbi:MAG TPA: hypothetical protein VGQ83_36595, partial [Polyangia bacterium]
MVEASARLVKVARAALVLAGAAADGVTQGDGLGPYARLAARLVAGCGRGTPGVIMTNPPFAGVGEGRIADPEVLRGFTCAARPAERDGTARPTAEGVPPELLFFERCLDWLRPGGRLGIVLPKSFLDTRTYLPARALLFARARLLGVVSLHKHTFQPHTGVRTCLVFVEKLAPRAAPPRAYPIFMALSRRVGQDSEGAPIYVRDAANRPTAELDHDLGEILAAWGEHRQGRLTASEHRFTVDRADLDADLRINPQLFLPSLNRTLREVAALDGVRGWSVVNLGAVAPEVAIFKGPRLQSERLLVERGGAPAAASGVEPYYTPSALLQENADGLKWLDLARATPAQRRTIAAIRVRRGDILVTRSGSIGRVVAVTARDDGAIVSDDMIRVRIADERTRLWVLRFLESPYGQDQMRRNEYGAIQQHLEPAHLRALLIPIPDDWGRLAAVLAATRAAVAAREALQAARAESHAALREALGID